MLFYTEKQESKVVPEKEPVSPEQISYDEEDERDDEYEKYDRSNGNYLF